MAQTTEFNHDTLAHLLHDNKLKIPKFQRPYAWDEDNVMDYWGDIMRAFDKGRSYFLGTVVLAEIEDEASRKSIVDGQQRMVTTALTMYAISAELKRLGKTQAGEKIFSDYIADYDLIEEETVPKLLLGPDDHSIYERIINGEPVEEIRATLTGRKPPTAVLDAFELLAGKVADLAEEGSYSRLVELSRYLDNDAQVLLAVASGLSEAYVIFETLNDRGAALTTADLLKNFFLSTAGDRGVEEALKNWTEIAGFFDDSEKLVSFIKADFTSRWGTVKKRDLYYELQDKVGRGSRETLKYLRGLNDSKGSYAALSSPDSDFWSSVATEIKDDLVANRRFQIEVPNAMYLAAMRQWRPKHYCELIHVGTAWSIRAILTGVMGGGTAEKVYGELASGISRGELKTVDDVRQRMISKEFLPSDSQFRAGLMAVSDSNMSRAKYLLAMVEKEFRRRQNIPVEVPIPWESKAVSVDHIIPRSKKIEVGADGTNGQIKELQHSLANLALLERSVNNGIGDLKFPEKGQKLAESEFRFTNCLSELSQFGDEEIVQRQQQILDLALEAWPI